MRSTGADKGGVGVDAQPRSRTSMPDTGVISSAGHEADCHRHAKCDGSTASSTTRTGTTVRLRSISGLGESDGQPGHTISTVRKRLFTMDDDASRQHSRWNNPHSGQSDTAGPSTNFSNGFSAISSPPRIQELCGELAAARKPQQRSGAPMNAGEEEQFCNYS